jgi:hypothetical protein
MEGITVDGGVAFDANLFFAASASRVPRRVPDVLNTYERSTDEQVCNRCHNVKPAIEYHTQKRFRLGIAKNCKKCTLGGSYVTTTEAIRCNHCKILLGPTEFPRDRRQLTGLKSKCKKCYASQSNERTTENTMCKNCEIVLPPCEYFTNKHNPSGIQGKCKECARQYDRTRALLKRTPT